MWVTYHRVCGEWWGSCLQTGCYCWKSVEIVPRDICHRCTSARSPTPSACPCPCCIRQRRTRFPTNIHNEVIKLQYSTLSIWVSLNNWLRPNRSRWYFTNSFSPHIYRSSAIFREFVIIFLGLFLQK